LSDIGLIGLGVMGENLVKNIASKGFTVAVYNRTREKTDRLIAEVSGVLDVRPSYSPEQLVNMLDRPRKIILMVEAGKAVDSVLNQLAPHLSSGDIVFDCGNSYFRDTERRQEKLFQRGVSLMGVGVSGGEEGALKGPSIMVGGQLDGYDISKTLWEKIAAKADGEPCAGYMGSKGAGHFVKMVHNGIEYALLQLIAETYDILRVGLGMPVEDIREIFREWLESELSSYLLEITVEALAVRDSETGLPLVDFVLDKAGQKGTGRWCVQTAAELGVPTPSIDAAVSARSISAYKTLRTEVSRKYVGGILKIGDEKIVDALADAFWATAVVSYLQGLFLIEAASKEYGYGTVVDEVLRVWRAGCIIRAELINTLRQSISEVGDAQKLLLAEKIFKGLREREKTWSEVSVYAKKAGIPTPVIDSSLNYYLSMKREKLPANIIQALRDRFGSHTFERIDRPGVFHSSWRPEGQHTYL